MTPELRLCLGKARASNEFKETTNEEGRTWVRPVRPFDGHFPAYFKLSKELPRFVSPHPELFFVPVEWCCPTGFVCREQPARKTSCAGC